jgi:Sec-independent protein translocase protein TatA
MAKENKTTRTLSDEDIVTSRSVSRRSLLAGAGVALGGAVFAGRSAFAADSDEKESEHDDKEESDKGDKAESDKGDKAESDMGDKAETDKGDKAEADEGDKSKIEYGRDSD